MLIRKFHISCCLILVFFICIFICIRRLIASIFNIVISLLLSYIFGILMVLDAMAEIENHVKLIEKMAKMLIIYYCQKDFLYFISHHGHIDLSIIITLITD